MPTRQHNTHVRRIKEPKRIVIHSICVSRDGCGGFMHRWWRIGTQNIQMAYSDHVYYTFCAIAILPINCMYQLHEEELCARVDCRRRRRRRRG